jgi:hypothetical protein
MARRNSTSNRKREYERRQQRRLKVISGGVTTSSEVGRILAAYVPIPAVWSATGFGTVAIVRQQPDGLCHYGFSVLELQRGGLYVPGGKRDLEADTVITELEEFLARNEIPASQPGDSELAGRLLYGAYAYSLEQDFSWPSEISQYLGLFPKPPGTAGDWLRWFKGPNGMICDGLWEIMQGHSDLTEEIPEGKDLTIVTRVLLAVPDTDRLITLLDKAAPEFSRDSVDSGIAKFTASRAYPKGHWNPMSRLPGARQNIGELELDKNESTVSVESNTLAFAARVITRIIELYGPGIDLLEAEYNDPNEEVKRSQGRS